MPCLLEMFRERSGDPAFWAEPLNALPNASFFVADSKFGQHERECYGDRDLFELWFRPADCAAMCVNNVRAKH